MNVINLMKDGVVVITFFTMGGAIIYWIIKSKISEEFITKDTYAKNYECHKENCDKKHDTINEYIYSVKMENKENIKVVTEHVDTVRAEIKEDIKEIKIMINNIQTWMIEFLQRKESK